MGCSITNLGDCVAEAVFGLFLDILNSASRPFLDLIKTFMIEPVSITAFADIWGIIVYILSMFYGLLIVWIGLKFIVSGESPEQREKAKSDLKNIIIMMILVQGSYLLYDLFLATSASLTNVIFDMVSNSFFRLSLESVSNFGFDLIFGILYIIHLIIVLVLVLLRYIFVSAGVILFAIGVFFYFIPFLNSYGRLILNGLGVLVFLPFFYSIAFLVGSKLAELNQFRDYKTLIMVGTLDIIILFTFLLLLFVIVKAATKVKPIVNVVKAVV
ncbi:MAG: hypothetical protein KKF48_02235 [Nanoarchaeota archaeon]|nr:hypothetical protein [Nanoarchaeota archaeon]MBU1027838.1 hypothetical protein [Nanoarchaeota archaeon]